MASSSFLWSSWDWVGEVVVEAGASAAARRKVRPAINKVMRKEENFMRWVWVS